MKKPIEIKNLSNQMLCRHFTAMNKHVIDENASHSYAYEYAFITACSDEMKKRGITEKYTYEFRDKNGRKIKE